MTDPLYFGDTLLFVAEAVVTGVTPSTYKDCKVLVTLDQTIFHPQGGGQVCIVPRCMWGRHMLGLKTQFHEF